MGVEIVAKDRIVAGVVERAIIVPRIWVISQKV